MVKQSENQHHSELGADLSRRQALKWFAVMGALAASPFGLPTGFARAAKQYGEGEKAYHSACTVNCGSSCFLKASVKDGKLVRIETDPSADSPTNRSNRACLRGRSMRCLPIRQKGSNIRWQEWLARNGGKASLNASAGTKPTGG